MSGTMRAVRFHDYGGPEVLQLEEIATPEPGSGQVLVRIHASSVNPIDWKLRAGFLRGLFPMQLPATAGQDLAGTVEAVGAGVSGFTPGDRVFAMSATAKLGAYADCIVMDEGDLALMPAALGFAAAAAVPMGALTAWQGVVEAGGLKAGDRLLVHAAAGNVGGMAVQIAHALGAHVTGAAFAKDRALVEAFGTDAFIAYDAAPFEGSADRFDIVFDTLAGDIQARSWGLVAPGGILVSTLGVSRPDSLGDQTVRATGMGCVPSGSQLARIAALVDQGHVRPRVAEVLPLERAAEAQELNRTGAVKGKIVLDVLPAA